MPAGENTMNAEMITTPDFSGKRTLLEIFTSEKYYKWTLIVPLLLTLAIFMFYPVIYCLYYSFHDWAMIKPPSFAGLQNYRDVLRDSTFWLALFRTAQVLVISIAAEITIGMGIAVMFNREFRGQNAVRGLILLPLLISPLAVAMMWNFFLQFDFGVINLALTAIGLSKVEWFAPGRAIYTLAFISIWQWTPFAIFVLLAGLKSLPRDMFEASRVDGASAWYTFWKITLPNLVPLIIIIVLLRTMWLIRFFDPLYGTTYGGAGTESLDWQVYRIALKFFDIGLGSTMAIISLVLTLVVCAVMFRELMKALARQEG